jgi:outer membrane receptor protein involved in Fe transport
VDLPTLNNDFCALQTRDADPNSQTFGGVIDFVQRPQNVAEFKTEGYDFEVTYALDTQRFADGGDYGLFTFHVIGNKLEELSYINLPGAPPEEFVGLGPIKGNAEAPEWQANFDLGWERGPLLINYRYSWFDETARVAPEVLDDQPDFREQRYLTFSAYETHDLNARYEFDGGISAYAGVNNLTNKKPDIGQTFYPVSGIGRLYFAGVEWRLQ